jgi:hypothetical protein
MSGPIYVVYLSDGYGPDYYEWPVAYYEDEHEAQRHISAFNEIRDAALAEYSRYAEGRSDWRDTTRWMKGNPAVAKLLALLAPTIEADDPFVLHDVNEARIVAILKGAMPTNA